MISTAKSVADLPADIPPNMRDMFLALLDAERWTALAPRLHVGGGNAEEARVAFDGATLAHVNARIKAEGYFQLPPVAWPLPIGDVADAVRAVVTAGHLPIFSFMYDEAWLLFAALERLIAGILDDGYAMLPAIWAWHVDGQREQTGWRPHRDQDSTTLRADGSPKSLTVWIPLADATPRNGCMYVLPADRDPLYKATMQNDIQLELQDIRALPSPAGGVLGWSQALLHWGARGSADAPPRISLSIEFQRGDEAPIKQPLLSPQEIPSPAQRLKLILRQLVQHQNINSVTSEMLAFAKAIVLQRP